MACISRVRPVTALCASSTIISGRCMCMRLANENLTPPPSRASKPARNLRQRAEMGFEILVVRINLAAFGVLYPEGLDRADNDAATVPDVVRPDVAEICDIEHAHPTAKGFFQRLPVRVARILQRLGGLPADRLRRRQPQHHRPVFFYPGVARDRDGMGAEDRLAAAGRQAQADIGDVRQPRQRFVCAAVAPEPPSLFWLIRYRFVCAFRPADARLLEEPAQDGERIRSGTA